MSEDKSIGFTDVIELGIRKYGMKVGDLKPLLVLEVGIKATRKYKAASQKQRGVYWIQYYTVRVTI